MEYSVKNVKSFQGREGNGYECTLYLDGKKIGTVTDVADGGGYAQFYISRKDIEKLDAHCKSLPRIYYGDNEQSTSLTKEQYEEFWKDGQEITKDTFLSSLVDKWENDKRMKRICRTKTAFTYDGVKKSSFMTINSKFSEAIKFQLEVKYKGKNLIIYNETICQ